MHFAAVASVGAADLVVADVAGSTLLVVDAVHLVVLPAGVVVLVEPVAVWPRHFESGG